MSDSASSGLDSLDSRGVVAADECLRGLGEVWVYLSEYRLTHGYLHVLLTDRQFARLADLHLADCLHTCGPTSGGPWQCRLTEVRGADEMEILFSAGERFQVRALRFHLVAARKE